MQLHMLTKGLLKVVFLLHISISIFLKSWMKIGFSQSVCYKKYAGISVYIIKICTSAMLRANSSPLKGGRALRTRVTFSTADITLYISLGHIDAKHLFNRPLSHFVLLYVRRSRQIRIYLIESFPRSVLPIISYFNWTIYLDSKNSLCHIYFVKWRPLHFLCFIVDVLTDRTPQFIP